MTESFEEAAINTAKSLMAGDVCDYCQTTDKLPMYWEYLTQSTMCPGCRDLFDTWIRMSHNGLREAFNKDFPYLKQLQETMLNLPEVRILRENLNKDK